MQMYGNCTSDETKPEQTLQLELFILLRNSVAHQAAIGFFNRLSHVYKAILFSD